MITRTPMIQLISASLLGFALTAQATGIDSNALRAQAGAFFKPLPATMPGSEQDTQQQVTLGKELYFETELSINGTQSCNSCHRVDAGLPGVDNEKTSPGALGKRGDRNSPTVWNAGFHVAQFWDGRAPDLSAQAKGPVLNPIEMGLPDEATAVAKLEKAGYKAKFAAAFPGTENALNYQNMADAIAAFERTLITSDRFDLFLKGQNDALSSAEQQGLQDFINAGCIACHNGELLGGQMYQKMGVVNAYPNTHDMGRFAVTNNPADKFVFKVPSLRDIANTAPYFHDGGAKDLAQAIYDMGWYQLGKKLDAKQVASIETFLKALNNQQPVQTADAE